jgi:AraC-like DNA-binding protein
MTFEPVPFTPKHPLLQQHIRYYYFLKTNDPGFETKYYAFPHTDTVLTIHQRANFEIKDYYTRVYTDAGCTYNACVQGIREYPLLAHLQGQLDKVTILFKPLGLNQFSIPAFGALYPKPSTVFTSWNDSPHYISFLNSFYQTNDITTRIDILEAFVLKMYQPVNTDQSLFKAIELLSRFDENYALDFICDELKTNVRALNRAFIKSLGVSPVAYRKVARFRHSLQNKLFDSKVKRLTDIAYQSNYYDQAYFNKMYRSLTGSNPQRFFNKINSLADDRLIFEFMEK